VHVDQSRQDRHVAEINDLGAVRRNRCERSGGGDASVFDSNRSVRDRLAAAYIDHARGAHDRHG
jgi:hypothetical protein